MTTKNILLISLVLLLGGLSLYLNRDRFGSPRIQISDRSLQPRGAPLRRQKDSTVNTVIFLLNRELKLTSVKVIAAGDIKTNKNPRAIWELISDSNSIPVKDIVYGINIRGMKPAIKGAAADPLQPGVKYRLLIKSGSLEAVHDFTPTPRTS